MSGIVALFQRDGRPVDPDLFARLLGELDHRGPAGSASHIDGPLAIGQQFLVRPEESGSAAWPLVDRGDGLVVAFEGRLDNRDELCRELGIELGVRPFTADAEICRSAYRRWNQSCLIRLVGAFALVVYDRERRLLLLARDALGDRSLCYRATPRELIVASEPAAVLAHPSVSRAVDEATLARFFAVEGPAQGRTFFAEVREIPPGCFVLLGESGLRVERYWSATDHRDLEPGTDERRVEAFRAAWVEAVRCRLRGTAHAHVLMSGGLDSTSVAAVASREQGRGAVAISWVFDETPGADERQFMNAMVDRWELDWRPIVADRQWPLRDLVSWPVDRNAPWQGLYCRLQNLAYQATRQDGETVLLTGEFGDHLYVGAERWLRALIAEGRWRDAQGCLRSELAVTPMARWLGAGRLRSAVARVVGWQGRVRRRARWLTPYAQELRSRTEPGELESWCPTIEPMTSHLTALETANAARHGIEVRRPYRDRRLVELVLGLPAHMLYRPGVTKWILREAMTGLLPEQVRQRRQISSLLGLAARGLVEREKESVGHLLADGDLWRRFVSPSWLAQAFPSRLERGVDGVEAVVGWQCLCASLWTR